MAKLAAQGLGNTDIAAIVGYSSTRISSLRGYPAFKELVAHYETAFQIHLTDMRERLEAIGLMSHEILLERLMDEPETLTTKELTAIIQISADRTGHGPSSTLNVNSGALTPNEREELRNASPRGPIIDVQSRPAGGAGSPLGPASDEGSIPATATEEGREAGGAPTRAGSGPGPSLVPVPAVRAVAGV